MALTVPRFAYSNLAKAAATNLSASSAQVSNPVMWLKDQLRSKTWRSKLGWTIVAGFNDKIDFNDGTNKVATVAPGTYLLAADLCAALVIALTAQTTVTNWASTYDPTTFKFTISADRNFILLFGTGANITSGSGIDLGFAVADTGTALTFTAGSASYQSRHYLKADLITAQAVQAGIIINHNLSANGTATLQGNAADAWSAPTVSQALTGDTTIRLAYIASQTLEFWRLVISDVQNVAGYAEVGVWFVGPYYQPPNYSQVFARTFSDLSNVSLATHGAPWQDQRPQAGSWILGWENIPAADKTSFEAIQAAMGNGSAFFFTFDTADLTGTKYVMRVKEFKFDFVPAATIVWNVAMELLEALG